MKKYVLFLFALSAFAPCLFAQTSEDALTQARDYVNDQMVLSILQHVKDSAAYKNAHNRLSANLQTQKIENSYPAGELQNIVKSTSDSALLNFANRISAIDVTLFSTLKKEPAAKGLVAACFDTLKKLYPDQSSSIENKRKTWSNQVTTYFGTQTADNNNDSESFVSPAAFYFFILLLLTLLAAAGFYLLQRFKRIEKKLYDLKRNDASPNSIPKEVFYDAVNKPQQQIQKSDIARMIDSNDAIKGFQKAIATLQEKVFQLETAQKKPSAPPNVAPPPKPAEMTLPQLPKQEQPAAEVFYMGGPVSNYFPATVKSLSKENTVYKFTVKANKEEASFELHTFGAPIKEIVSLSESYIKPACDEENMPPANVRNIITAKPGLALLEGDKWMIKNKALIRYE